MKKTEKQEQVEKVLKELIEKVENNNHNAATPFVYALTLDIIYKNEKTKTLVM